MSDTVTPDHDDTELSEHDKARWAFIHGLGDLAAWYARHPDAPLPRFPELRQNVMADDDATGVAQVEQMAALLGVAVEYDTHATAVRRFGSLEFRVAYASRESMANYTAHMAHERPPVETRLAPVNPAPWTDTIVRHTERAPHAYPDRGTA